jgi:hypothetical protein
VLGFVPDRRERDQWSSAFYATKAQWGAAYLARGEAGACRGRTGLGRAEQARLSGVWLGMARHSAAGHGNRDGESPEAASRATEGPHRPYEPFSAA